MIVVRINVMLMDVITPNTIPQQAPYYQSTADVILCIPASFLLFGKDVSQPPIHTQTLNTNIHIHTHDDDSVSTEFL